MANDEVFMPRIAVLGAGPIGLEAALYARYLGYEVAVFERGEVADQVRQWGHVPMFSPFGMNRSTLGAAALQAQGVTLPAADAMLTGEQYRQEYLLPLAESDLLSGCVHTNTRVHAVGRDGVLRSDEVEDRAEFDLRLLVESDGQLDTLETDVVLDTTGVWGQPCPLGHGGIAAPGETVAHQRIDYGVPDVLGERRADFAGQHTLVVGGGYSAATTVVALAELAKTDPQTRVTWATRRALEPDSAGPLPRLCGDRLAARDALAAAANQLAMNNESCVTHFAQAAVLRIELQDDGLCVHFGDDQRGQQTYDRIVACTGFRPDLQMLQELQLDWDPVYQGLPGVAKQLRQAGATDCLDLDAVGAEALTLREPDFYVLGSKANGRSSNFLLAYGLTQIRDAFTIIADRDDLDLYQSMAAFVK